MKEFSLICSIVNERLGSKVIKVTKQAGANGATVFYGKGLIKHKVLEILGMDYLHKEIVFVIVEKVLEGKMLAALADEMSIEKPNHGIAFSLPLNNVLGLRNTEYNERSTEKKNPEEGMYEAIFTVVNKGSAEEVIDAAKKKGAKGGTIINARGSGIHETEILFAMEIEPEKEIVLILVKKELTHKIIEVICAALKIQEPGNGIIFTLNVNQAVGLIG